MAFYKSKYTGTEIDQRLTQGTYDDAVKAGFTGSKEEFDKIIWAFDENAQQKLDAAQPKVDQRLETLNKSVADAINELHDEINQKQDVGDYADKGEFEVFKDEVAAIYATKGQVSEEIEQRKEADTQLASQHEADVKEINKTLNTIKSESESQYSQLEESLQQETADRQAEDAKLDSSIKVETEARIEADNNLQNAISEESTAREALAERVLTLENADYQTEADITAKINEVVDNAPEELNTLNKIAESLNNDPDFAGTVTQELAKKADQTAIDDLSEELELKADKSEIPTKLPNPEALTVNYNGVQVFTYDGSKAETGNLVVNATTVPMSEDLEAITIAERFDDIMEGIPINIPIRTLQDKVYTQEEILQWFGVDNVSTLKRTIVAKGQMFLKYGIQLSENPYYYRMPIEYIAFESANQIKLISLGLNTKDDNPVKYVILINLDGTIIEGNSNIKMTLESLYEDIDLSSYLTKVDAASTYQEKEEGKGLSTNDYTTAEKEKLAGLENYDDTELFTQLQQTEAGVATNLANIEKLQSSKQDNLVFNTGYNPDTNKAATMSDVSSAVNALDASEITTNTGEIINSIKQEDGVVIVNKKTLTIDDIPQLVISKVIDLQTALDSKQATLTAGTGLEITPENVINVTLDTEVFFVAQELPESPTDNQKKKICLIPTESEEIDNLYSEYVWIVDDSHPDGYWEKFGEFKAGVDLTPYLKASDAQNTYLSKTDAQATYQPIGDYATNTELATDLAEKQNITDNSLTTTAKTIVAALNELVSTKVSGNTKVNVFNWDEPEENGYTDWQEFLQNDGLRLVIYDNHYYVVAVTHSAPRWGCIAYGYGDLGLCTASFYWNGGDSPVQDEVSLDYYQAENDEQLTTEAKTIVGAINEVLDSVTDIKAPYQINLQNLLNASDSNSISEAIGGIDKLKAVVSENRVIVGSVATGTVAVSIRVLGNVTSLYYILDTVLGYTVNEINITDNSGVLSKQVVTHAFITENKIVNTLDSDAATLPLSAAQGKSLNETKQNSTVESLPTTAKTVEGAIAELKTAVDSKASTDVVNAKQNATDQSLQTTDKTVVGAINELASKPSGVGKVDPNSDGTGEVFNYYEGEFANVASGSASHAEGANTTASASGAHAEGYNTTASGNYSHAEGYNTTASGNDSHSEGNLSTASGAYSHAEGDHTEAFGASEHSEGKYNKSYKSTSASVRVIHSVGIGSAESDRKNAHEIKINGDHYVYGVGGFDGTNSDTAQSLQEVINNKAENFTAGTGLEMTEDRHLNVTTDLTPYLKSADAANTYLSKTDASSTYLSKTDAASTYATNSRLSLHINSANPHNVTKGQIGLGNVNNTSDEDKPVSTAQQTALDLKQNITDNSLPTTSKTITGAITEIYNKQTIYTEVPTLTADYNIPANDTFVEHTYIINIGDTVYNVTGDSAIRWAGAVTPVASANAVLVVSVVKNLATWNVFMTV